MTRPANKVPAVKRSVNTAGICPRRKQMACSEVEVSLAKSAIRGVDFDFQPDRHSRPPRD